MTLLLSSLQPNLVSVSACSSPFMFVCRIVAFNYIFKCIFMWVIVMQGCVFDLKVYDVQAVCEDVC